MSQEKSKKKSNNNDTKAKEQIDIVNVLKTSIKDNKEIVASFIVIIGVLISVCRYVYYQGYYSYFGVDDKWINAGDTSFFYKIVLPLCGSILFLFPNLISALPYLLNEKKHKRIWYDVLWSLTSFSFLLLLISLKISVWILLFGGIGIIIIILASLSKNDKCSYISLAIWSIIDIIIGFIVFCKRNMLPNGSLLGGLFLVWILMVWLCLPFIPIEKPDKPEINDNENKKRDKIKERNISLIAFVIGFLLVYSIFVVMLYSDGQTDARDQINFKVILLDEEEYYGNILINSTKISSKHDDDLLSNLPNNTEEKEKIINEIEEKYSEKPYIKIIGENEELEKKVIRRIVNAYIVIASDGENSLVMNGYIDENANLFCFAEEQKTIETNGVVTNNMIFNKVIRE